MANMAFAFFLMMGAVGFYGAFAFTSYIYRCAWLGAATAGHSQQYAAFPCVPSPSSFYPSSFFRPPRCCSSIKTD